jgi:phosphoglucosamine mutase
VAASAEVAAAVTAARTDLGAEGRILLRPSGTEELVRVMVEARTQSQAAQVARRVADVVEAQ